MLTPLAGQLSPLTASAVRRIVQYLLRDEFSSGDLTSPRTCTPGPGTITIVDTQSKMSLVDGKLRATPNAVGWNVEGFYSSAITRAVGRVVYVQFNRASGNQITPLCLFSTQIVTTPSNTANAHGLYVLNGVLYVYVNGQGGNGFSTGISLPTGVDYQLLFLLRASGAFLFVKGGVYTSWTFVHVTSLNSAATLYAMMSTYQGTADFDNLTVQQLSAPFDNEASWRTAQLLNPAIGAITNHATDFVLDITYTHRTASAVQVTQVRKLDSTHHFTLYVSNSQMTLQERNGTVVNRAVYSWTTAPVDGNTVQPVMTVVGNVYRGYVKHTGIAPVGCWSYVDASNLFLTETSAYVQLIGGGISELNFWPACPELAI